MKALIVDDDRTLADLLAFTLRREGFEPHLAFDTRGAMDVFDRETVDIVILDVNLPGQPGLVDGFDVCRAMRQVSDVPIILLTVRDEEEDIIKGLNIGADDYVLKPFSPRQLVARVQSVLRRSSSAGAYQEAVYSFGQLTFDPNMREITWGEGNPIKLTRLESRLLEYMMINTGQILPAENIIAYVWGPGAGSTEMLRQLVRRLRVKIEREPGEPALIANLPGVGYGLGV